VHVCVCAFAMTGASIVPSCAFTPSALNQALD